MISVVYPSENMAMFNIHSLQKRCFTTLSKEPLFNMTNANLPSESYHMPNSSDSEVLYISGCSVLRDEFDKFIRTEVDVTTHFLCRWLPRPLFRIENARVVRIKSL